MKIAFFDAKPYDRPGFDAYTAGTGLDIKYFETKLSEDTVSLASGADGVCVFVNDTLSESVVDALYALGVRVIVLRCAGFNNVDIRACFGKLRVFRVPAYSPYAVAEHAMALLLTVNRHTNKAYIRTRDFNFSLAGLTGFDLHGKTVGVVGTGKIGRTFAGICTGFGMRVLAYDKFPSPDSGLSYVTLPELLTQADVISLHCPLLPETTEMICEETIAKMKDGAILLNTSRGGLLNEAAVAQALETGKLSYAAVDVVSQEPILAGNPLLSAPNCIITPHMAWAPVESRQRLMACVEQNLAAFLRGRAQNVVN